MLASRVRQQREAGLLESGSLLSIGEVIGRRRGQTSTATVSISGRRDRMMLKRRTPYWLRLLRRLPNRWQA